MALIHDGYLYKTLLEVGSDAKAEADRIIREAIFAAAPELNESNERVLLEVRRTEETLRRLCAGNDYRQLLHASRLCSVVPALTVHDANHEDRRLRTLSADR